MKKRLLTTAILVTLGLQNVAAQTIPAAQSVANNSNSKIENFPSDAVIKSMLKKLVDDGRAAGIAVGLLEADGKRRVISYGSPGAGRLPLDGDSVFEIGSISKVFTGTLLADMVIRGEVKLDDPVEKYLPQGVHVPTWGERPITLLDLSTHASGLPRMPTNFRPQNAANPYVDYSVQNLYEFLNEYKLLREPGTQKEYSNLGTALLGHVLALKAGLTYEELIARRILRPIGMRHTGVTLTSDMQKHFVQGHNEFGEPVSNWDLPTFAGAGGLRSSMNDMLRFAAANLSEKTGSPFEAMRIAQNPRSQLGPTGSVGLNWMVSGDPTKRTATWHNGGTGGFRTFLGLDKTAHRAVVILTNSTGAGCDDLGFHLLDPSSKLNPTGVAITMAKEYSSQGIDRVLATYRERKEKASENWIFNENQLNNFGYWLLRNGHKEDAVKAFKLNVETYPNNWVLYDSLGEGYLAVGDREQAIKYYRRAVEINPKNTSSIEALKKLGAYP